MTSEAPSKSSESAVDFRMGWLEAFVSVARHRSYEEAGLELGLNRSSVKRNVEALERWLGRFLVSDDPDIVLSDPDGHDVLAFAERTLQSLRDLMPSGTRNGASISKLTLSDIRAFLALRDGRTFLAAADEVKCSEGQARRKIKKLEDIFDCKLVEGRSSVRLSNFGNHICSFLSVFVEGLNLEVKIAPQNEIHVQTLRRLYIYLVKRKAELNLIIARASRKARPRKIDKINGEAAKQALILIDTLLDLLKESRPHPPDKDIII